MLIILKREDSFHPAGEGPAGIVREWSSLALLAAEAGHLASARLGFDRANDMMRYDILSPRQRDEKARLVREAVGLGQFAILDAMHQTTSKPGAWTRYKLARVYRKRGEDAKAAALLDEGIAIADPHNSKDGASLAWIAVELQQIGQPDRAEHCPARLSVIASCGEHRQRDVEHRRGRRCNEPRRPPRPALRPGR